MTTDSNETMSIDYKYRVSLMLRNNNDYLSLENT